jgi:hypothetical protein
MLRKLTGQQIQDHKTCHESVEMVMININEALESDGVDNDSMTALAKEFEAMVFLGPGRVLVGELNEDTVTTTLIVDQRLMEIEETLKNKEHYSTRIWETSTQDGIALLTQAGGAVCTH